MIESKILTEEEAVKLYDMVSNQLGSNILDFSLVYRGTEDGFKFDDFWQKCDEIKPAFVIIETVRNKVFGGYASVGFKKYTASMHIRDHRAFLYSIRNDAAYPPKVFTILPGQEYTAIVYGNNYLCCFGGNGCGICLPSECNLPDKNCGSKGTSFMNNSQSSA